MPPIIISPMSIRSDWCSPTVFHDCQCKRRRRSGRQCR